MTVNIVAPLNYNFLLWDRYGEPFDGIELIDLDGNGNYLLQRGNKVVGHVTINAPDDAVGQALTSDAPAIVVPTPVIGTTMTARWVVSFLAGNRSGLYTVTLKLNGGNEINMYVNVTE